MADSFIPYGRQSIDDDDIEAVVTTLRSDFLTSGPKINEFETTFASFVGSQHAIAVCNATAALHLALKALDIGPGDRVITSPNTFLSSANCAAFVGATPDFCDIDPITHTLCPKALEEMWTDDIKAVIAVAHGGQSADMVEIARIARERGAAVIEDACHGTGGGFERHGQSYKLGSHPWADITTFSFHPVKTLTTGEGGILTTQDDVLAAKFSLLRSHGMTRDPSEFSGLGSDNSELSEIGPWYYEMQELGYNYRITDFQCSLGLSQLKKLPAFMKKRREIVDHYNSAFQEISWLTPPGCRSSNDRDHISWHLYTVLIDFEKIGKTRSEVVTQLRARGIGTQVLYIPVYLQPWYRKTYGYQCGKCPQSEAYYRKALSLPLHPSLTLTEIKRVIRGLSELGN